VIWVGFSRKRIGRDGKARFTAYYIDLKGRERSAGTFSNKKQADKEWQKAETKLAEGRVGDPARGRMVAIHLGCDRSRDVGCGALG
jgi:hypothetical protein